MVLQYIYLSINLDNIKDKQELKHFVSEKFWFSILKFVSLYQVPHFQGSQKLDNGKESPNFFIIPSFYPRNTKTSH